MTESLGTAALYLTVDTAGMDAAISRAQARVKSYSAETGAALAQLSPAMQKQAKRWLEVADNATIARKEQILYKATVAGMPTQVIADLATGYKRAALAAAETASATKRAADEVRRLTAIRNEEAASTARGLAAVRERARIESESNARIATNRSNALQAFGVEMGARERAIVGMRREEGVRDRLNNLLRTERGARIAAAEAARNQSNAIAGSVGGLNNASKAFSGSSKSVRELQFAMRGLPAQFTDIGVSLASGQRPLLVLLQQGGQLKDMFGGIRPALGAIVTGLRSMINPATLAAAAIGGLAVVLSSAQNQAIAFNKALIATGGFAGRTSDELQRLAEEFDRIAGVTASGAASIIAKVAQSGQFTGEVFDQVAEAAVRASEAGTKSADDVIEAFKEIGKDPVAALLKLDQAENFLTQTQIERIRVLQNEGREQDAIREATSLYFDVINDRSGAAYEQVNSIASAFRAVGNAISEAYDKAVNADFGALLSQIPGASQIAKLGLLAAPFIPGGSSIAASFGGGSKPDFSNVRGSPDFDPKDDARKQRQLAFEKQGTQYLEGRKRLTADIAEMEKAAIKDGVSRVAIEKRKLEMTAQFDRQQAKKAKKGPKGPSENSIQQARDRFSDIVGGVKSELEGPLEKVEQKHIARMREIEQAAKKGKVAHSELAAALVLEGQAYKLASDEVQNRYAVEIAGLSGPLAQEMAEHEQSLRRIDQIRKETTVTGDQYNAMLAEETRRHQAQKKAIEDELTPFKLLLEDMKFELDMIGKSNAERAVMIELRRRNIDVMSAEAQEALATAQAFEVEAKAKQTSIDLMDQFRDSASNALYDFVTGAKSAKDAFKDFFDTIAKAITKAIADKWIAQLFGEQGSDKTGSQGASIFNLIGKLFGMADGGAFSGGVQKFAMGGVVGGPTAFGMSGGRMGVMGEAGPEAIMPLRRGPDGKLGVQSSGGANVISITQNVMVEGRPTKQTFRQMERASGRGAAREMRRA